MVEIMGRPWKTCSAKIVLFVSIIEDKLHYIFKMVHYCKPSYKIAIKCSQLFKLILHFAC